MVPGYIIAQMLGGIVGAILVWLAYLPHWKATKEPEVKLGVFSTAPSIPNYFANFITEIIGTGILTLGLLFIGMNNIADGLNPLIVGALIVAIGVSIGGPTGYAINPSRDLGPKIAHTILPIAGKGGSNWGYAIVPVLGPLSGGMIGAMFYRLFYKGIFDTMSIISIAIFIATLILGVMLNKIDKKNKVEKIY